jgi:hypothetical protein
LKLNVVPACFARRLPVDWTSTPYPSEKRSWNQKSCSIGGREYFNQHAKHLEHEYPLSPSSVQPREENSLFCWRPTFLQFHVEVNGSKRS